MLILLEVRSKYGVHLSSKNQQQLLPEKTVMYSYTSTVLGSKLTVDLVRYETRESYEPAWMLKYETAACQCLCGGTCQPLPANPDLWSSHTQPAASLPRLEVSLWSHLWLWASLLLSQLQAALFASSIIQHLPQQRKTCTSQMSCERVGTQGKRRKLKLLLENASAST